MREYAESRATDDVRATLRWLDEAGYVLTEAKGGAEAPMGSAALVFTGRCEVRIILESGQWCLDVAATPGAKPIQYDLLLPAREGRDYSDYYAGYQAVARDEPGERSRLPEQLPPGVSWRQTLPSVLEWITRPEVTHAVALVADQRYVLMWPTSHKARDLRRRWRQQAQASRGTPVQTRRPPTN